MNTYTFKPKGVCSSLIELKITDEGIIEDIRFTGGCNGNLKGISSLCRNLKPQDVIEKLSGIKCGMKNTSCPDQLAECLIAYLEEQKAKVVK